MVIIGASLTGLLASALSPGSNIVTPYKKGATDHKAVLRMRTDKIQRLTGIDFKKVSVMKSIWFQGKEVDPTPRFIHMYSRKVAGAISDRSISNIDTVTRYIPPDDFQEQLEHLAGQIHYEWDKTLDDLPDDAPIVNTLSLDYALAACGIEQIEQSEMKTKPIFVNQFKIENCNSYCTIYYPDKDMDIYRASLNGNTLIVESVDEIDVNDSGFGTMQIESVLSSLGLDWSSVRYTVENYKQNIGKMSEIDDLKRKNLILHLTTDHNIYSLGRKATWKPKLLLEDVITDLDHVKTFIKLGNYSAKMHTARGEK